MGDGNLTLMASLNVAREPVSDGPAAEDRITGMWSMSPGKAAHIDRLVVIVDGVVVAVRRVTGVAAVEPYSTGGRVLTRLRFATAPASAAEGELLGTAIDSTRNPVRLVLTRSVFSDRQLEADTSWSERGPHGTNIGEINVDSADPVRAAATTHHVRATHDSAGATDSVTAGLTPASSAFRARVLGFLLVVDPETLTATLTMPAGGSAHIIPDPGLLRRSDPGDTA